MRLLVGLLRRGRVLGAWIRLAWVDGQPSAVLYDAKGRVVSVVELDVADGVVRRSALWSTPASLVISDRCLMWRDCRPRRTPNSEPRSTVTQRTGIPSRTAAQGASSWTFSITQCDAVGKLAGARSVADAPGRR